MHAIPLLFGVDLCLRLGSAARRAFPQWGANRGSRRGVPVTQQLLDARDLADSLDLYDDGPTLRVATQ